MKIRLGFVSNSSSTSFIVASKNSLKLILKIEVDLFPFVEETLKTKAEVDQYFEDYDKEKDGEYAKCIEALKSGKKVYVGNLANDTGNGLEAFLCENGIPETEGIEIIHSEEGF